MTPETLIGAVPPKLNDNIAPSFAFFVSPFYLGDFRLEIRGWPETQPVLGRRQSRNG
jgi:hypothetical protein